MTSGILRSPLAGKPVRILIVKMSALGDIVHALPVLDYLKSILPAAEIDWVVEEHCRQVIELNPHISRLQVVKTRKWRKAPFARSTWREIGELGRTLKERSYDYVFDIQGNLKSGLVTWLTGAPRRIGMDGDEVQERANLLFTTLTVPVRRRDRHVTSRSLRIVSVPFGVDYTTVPVRGDIYTAPEEDAAAELLLSTMSDGLVFLFQHGTTWPTKLWHEEGWIGLGKGLLARYPGSSILLNWGSDAEREGAQRICAGIGGGARAVPWLTVRELAALARKVDLVIGGDSGPLHIAAAVGTPTVSLFRATDPERNGPQGADHRAVATPLECGCCWKGSCSDDAACRESITVEDVLAAVEKLFPQKGEK
ncbi:MAG TPA: lipopolysaccharide heptosyltransferase I [Verrucomicrobiae bacterium]|nr:lipopolysaccharide heptosyltransferase I [Verrucomicrobiae bacterium]